MARYTVNDFYAEVASWERRACSRCVDAEGAASWRCATRPRGWPGAPKQRPETGMTRLGVYAAKSLGIGPLKFETDSAGLVFILYDGLPVRRPKGCRTDGLEVRRTVVEDTHLFAQTTQARPLLYLQEGPGLIDVASRAGFRPTIRQWQPPESFRVRERSSPARRRRAGRGSPVRSSTCD